MRVFPRNATATVQASGASNWTLASTQGLTKPFELCAFTRVYGKEPPRCARISVCTLQQDIFPSLQHMIAVLDQLVRQNVYAILQCNLALRLGHESGTMYESVS
jgi:hypothetical protein